MSRVTDGIGGKDLKRKVLDILRRQYLRDCLKEIILLPERQVINPLISFLLHSEPITRWRSVMCIGDVLNQFSFRDMEGVRVIMRRFMWSLNDESGGIGWGAPESMCVSIAKNEKIAGEYGHMVVTYVDPDGNYLEYEPLQRGLLWGVVYLAKARPELLQNAKPHLAKYLDSKDAHVRGFAAMTLKMIRIPELSDKLQALVADKSSFVTYEEDRIRTYTVGSKAAEALEDWK